MNSLYELETLGFTIIQDIFAPSTISRLREKLEMALQEDKRIFGGKKGKKDDLVVDLSIHDSAFLQALDNDVLLDVFTSALENPILYSYTSTILRPGTVGGVRDIHVDTQKYIPGFTTGLVMTLALEDFTDENGATLYLPGSHRSAATPTEETFSKYALSTARKAGDALFFNPRVYHRAGINRSDDIRYGLTVYATRSYMKQRLDFPRMIPHAFLDGLSKRALGFLGFDSCPPESLDQFYAASGNRNYK